MRLARKHPGREGLKLDGVVAQQEVLLEAQLVRGECLDAAVPQGQPGTVN